jgi:hypothetical protein
VKIRLTCPSCSAAKVLSLRAGDIGKRIRTRCACGRAIEARPTGKAEAAGRLMDRLRDFYATVDRLSTRTPEAQ